MACFPTYGQSLRLARAALDPSTSLRKKFSAIDEWHDRLAPKDQL
jgi:hypothetical protein